MSVVVELPPTQRRLFDKMSREFDNREYTKALRTGESILATNPEHPDTVAMVGLTLHHLDRKEEAYEHIRRAISLNATSTIAWHSLGMCNRADHDYVAAYKAFKRASTTDPTNLNVLRDLSTAAIQLREWDTFLEIREKMVTQKASVRANWIALSCAHRMLGNVKLAAAVMDVMAGIMDIGENPVEISEVQLYRVELALESGSGQQALELLKKHDAEIKDQYVKLQCRAKAHTLLGQKAEAEKRYLELMSLGYAEGDCVAAIAQLHKIALDEHRKPKQPQQMAAYVELLEGLKYDGKRGYIERHLLDCCPLDQFKSRLLTYVLPFIKKMIPSLFSVLKSLYLDHERALLVGELFNELREQLEAGDFATNFGGEKRPSFILWVYAYLATHYRRLGDYANAHLYIEKAIAHTPTLEMLYVEKAKIFQGEGKTAEAAEVADFARTLDLQDKYMNNVAARFHFRNNDIAKGEETMQIFYKEPTVAGDTYLVALESQCSWYEKEVGEAFYRKGDYISALQNLLMFEHHHRQNHYELTDFHNYVFRRNTMRAWFDVITTHDNMEGNKFFRTFCPGLVRTYMKVHELGEEAVRAAHVPRPQLPLEGLNADDAKRITQMIKDNCISEVDLSEPLKKANRYMNCLLKYESNDVHVHLLAIELYTLADKPLLVARALAALKKLKYAELAPLVQSFQSTLLAKHQSSMDPRAKEVMDALLDQINK